MIVSYEQYILRPRLPGVIPEFFIAFVYLFFIITVVSSGVRSPEALPIISSTISWIYKELH